MLFRNICFTVNNYHESDFERLIDCDDFGYIVIGREVGESGTPHLQGYCELIKRTSFTSARRFFPAGTHIEGRKGTQAQAIKYCKKDGIFRERGEPRAQGRRHDLELIRSEIDAGASELDIATDHFNSWCRYRKSFDAYRCLLLSKSIPDSRVTHFWYGSTGTGKSRLAADTYPDAYWHSTGKWFQDYRGQEVVIFDDLRPGVFTIGELLRLTDPHPKPIRVEFKGGSCFWCASVIIITTNTPLDEWFTADNSDVDAFRRRVRVKRFSDIRELGQ